MPDIVITDEHRELIPDIVEKWVEIGLRTEPADREATEQAIAQICKIFGYEPPPIHWANSCFEAITYLVEEKGVAPSDVLKDVALWGANDANWMANYEFFLEVGVSVDEETKALYEASKVIVENTHWVWLYDEVVVISERPCAFHIDPDEPNQLHCMDGPAIEFRDGWGVYYVHGVEVPGWIIDNPEQITVEKIKETRNAEIKRIMREIYGEGRYLKDIDAKVIDTDARNVSVADITEQRLVGRALVEDDEGFRYLIGTDGSTQRVYYMQVPNTCTTCKEAHEELCGFDESRIISQS